MKVGCNNSLLLTKIEYFKEIITKKGKSFAFRSHKIRCIDLDIFSSMVIFTISHVLWNLKPILIQKAHLPKLVELLKEKMYMKILKPFLLHILILGLKYLKKYIIIFYSSYATKKYNNY